MADDASFLASFFSIFSLWPQQSNHIVGGGVGQYGEQRLQLIGTQPKG